MTGKIYDWTKKTLVLDFENSLGEKFHFEIEPNPAPAKIDRRVADSTDTKSKHPTMVWIQLPLFEVTK